MQMVTLKSWLIYTCILFNVTSHRLLEMTFKTKVGIRRNGCTTLWMYLMPLNCTHLKWLKRLKSRSSICSQESSLQQLPHWNLHKPQAHILLMVKGAVLQSWVNENQTQKIFLGLQLCNKHFLLLLFWISGWSFNWGVSWDSKMRCF